MRRKNHYVIIIRTQYDDEHGTTSLTVVRYDRPKRAKLYTCTEYEYIKTRDGIGYTMIHHRIDVIRRPYSTVEHNIALAGLVAIRNEDYMTVRVYTAK